MDTICTNITDYLLNQTWQIAILFVAVAIVCVTIRKKTAHLRYLLWLLIIAKCLVPSLITVSLAILPQQPQPLPLQEQLEIPEIVSAPELVILSEAKNLSPPAPTPALQPSIMAQLAQIRPKIWFSVIWLGGVGLFLLIVLIKAARFNRRLRRQRKRLTVGMQKEIDELLDRFGVHVKSRIWLLDGIGQPFVWGLLRGSIYLPANFGQIGSREHRRGILMHEIAHTLRFDAAVNILQTIAQAIFWFHPLVWWANRNIRAEREKCCDETTIARLSAAPRGYSSAIVDTLIAEYQSTQPIPSLAIAGPIKNIEDRIKTIMKPGKKFYNRPTIIAIITTLLLAIVAVPTTVALTHRQPKKPEEFLTKSDVQVESEDKQNKIKGIVRDRTGNPVAGALVLPLPHGGHPVKTDIDGRFEIAGSSEDRRIETLFVRELNNNQAAVAELSDYNQPLDITLTSAITVTGRLTDPNGMPIAGAKIHPSVHTEEWGAGFGYTVFQPTDGNGYYEIKTLPVGQDYSIATGRVDGYGGNSIGLGLLDLPGRKELDDIVVEPANLSVSGVVLDDEDKPVAGVDVDASGKIQPHLRVKTDSKGRFKIDGVCKGRVELLALNADHSWSGTEEANGGNQNIEIFMSKGRQTCMIPPKNPPASLVGKAMPSLETLGIRLAQKDIRGKRVLVCFWKLMHDESRDYIRQLAARTDELAKKNIVIVAAQIWPSNEKQFRRWLAKNNAKFPASILPDPWEQEPEQRPTYYWGMQNRVPWLILTDTRHIVSAEGFEINKLNEKIRQPESLLKNPDVQVEVEPAPEARTDLSKRLTPSVASDYKATLPNGVTVELLGVCEHPSAGKRWWRPDGNLMELVPYDKIENPYLKHIFANPSGPPGSQRLRREFALRLSGMNETGHDIRFIVMQNHGAILELKPIKNGVPAEGLRAIAALIPIEDSSVRVEIGVADGPFKTFASGSPDFDNSFSRLEGQFDGRGSFTNIREIDGKTTLTVTDNFIDYDRRVVAVDKSGTVHLPDNMAPMNISGVRITTVEFNGLPLENIKEFQLQRRSYEWAKFKKVALRPNQKSDVQVEGKLNVTKLLTVLEQERFVHIRQGIILMVDEIGDKEPISFLSEQLKSKDRKRRCDAALALELLGDRRGVPAIIKELNDTSYRPTERIKSDGSEDQEGQVKQDHYYAALLLGILGDERAVPALIEATQEETIDYRAATSLGQIGDKRAIPALRDMLERCSDKPFPRLFAGYGLAMLGDKEGLKVVIDTLNTHQENWTIRRHAIEALGDLGNKEAVPYLITALKDEHPNIRVSAAVSLGVIGDNSALPALEQALKDKTETKINAPTTVSKAAEKASDQILKQSSKPDVQAEGQDAQMKARAEAAAEAIAQINNRDGTLGEGFLSKTPNQLLNAIPVLRLEKAKYVIGESIRFWVGVECLDDDVIIPEKYWNTCFLHITRPDGTIKKESVGWPIDGMLHTGWMGGWGFGKEDVQVGKYTLVFEFANKKTEPVELIVEELDVLRKIKATFDFQRAGNISKGEHIPIILTVQNNSKHVIQFPRRGVSDALVSIRVKRQEPSMESGFFYPIERLKGTLKNTYNWDRAASVPPIVLGPGERFEQKLWLEKAYELWGPGEYEVTFSTVLALFVGEKNGKFAAYCPIRLSIVTTENFRVITQGHGQEELAD